MHKGMSNNDIINSIRSKNLPIKVSFNNQETLEKLAGRIATQIEADSVSLLKTMKDDAFLDENNFKQTTALGMYLPNSYEFFWNTSAEEFRARMLKEYNRFWNASRLEKAKALGLSEDEVITLASIVYEESKQVAEQPRIAGVYLNRIRIGMPLQADPTLKFAAYQLPKYKNTIIKRVLDVHKEIKSPYNTYKNLGLPPGLIAMPDISAIDAVLNYEKHNYYYFVANANLGAIFAAGAVPAITNGQVWEYQHHIYYVREEQQGSNTVPVLMQGQLSNTLNFAPIIDGIEIIRFEYGIDMQIDHTVPGYGVVDAYVTANNMTEPLWNNANSRIISVKIYVLARSIQPDNKYENTNTYQLPGFNYTVDDNYRRLLFTSTVTLYNAGVDTW